jgi:hypothetical protein
MSHLQIAAPFSQCKEGLVKNLWCCAHEPGWHKSTGSAVPLTSSALSAQSNCRFRVRTGKPTHLDSEYRRGKHSKQCPPGWMRTVTHLQGISCIITQAVTNGGRLYLYAVATWTRKLAGYISLKLLKIPFES